MRELQKFKIATKLRKSQRSGLYLLVYVIQTEVARGCLFVVLWSQCDEMVKFDMMNNLDFKLFDFIATK